MLTVTAVEPQGDERPQRGPEVLDLAACRALLARVGWGVLATIGDGGQPYAVPVGYALGGDCVYVASGPGQKRRFLEANPRVCLTVCEVDTLAHWRSVVVQGIAAPVEGFAARAQAMAAFMTQRAPRARAADARRLASAYIVRIPLDGMTGRRRGD